VQQRQQRQDVGAVLARTSIVEASTRPDNFQLLGPDLDGLANELKERLS
jgi:hypothetical protein